MSEHIYSTIDDAGFAAILSGETREHAHFGVLGAPRINPTANGLSIADSYALTVEDVQHISIRDFTTTYDFGAGDDAYRLTQNPRPPIRIVDILGNDPARSWPTRESALVGR